MDQQLINLSQDLKRLLDDGFDIEITKDGGHLLVHHLPYVNKDRKVTLGTLITALTLATPTQTGRPSDHTVHFIGETPCNSNGIPLTSSIINNSIRTKIAENLWGDHYFSSKPACGFYQDYYEKVWTYAEILYAQACIIDATVTYKPNKKPKTHA
jgi:hypothetical protein